MPLPNGQNKFNLGALQQQQGAPQQFQPAAIDIQPDGMEQEVNQEEQPQEDPNGQYLKQIAESLGSQRQGGQQNELLTRLTANPLVQQILLAEQQGKKVKLADDVEADPFAALTAEDTEGEPNWEEMAQNPQKLASHVSKQVSREVTKQIAPAVKQILDQRLQVLDQVVPYVKQLGAKVQQYEQTRTQGEFDAIRNTNPAEFDSLKPLMAEIYASSPNLSLKRVYALARMEKGLPIAQDQSISTERPTSNTAARPPVSSGAQHPQQYKPQRGGNMRANFDQQLANLLQGQNLDFGPDLG